MSDSTDASVPVPSEAAVSVIGVAASSKAPRDLTSGEFTALSVVGALVGVIGLIGFVNSFAKVATAAEPFFGWLAWSVPLGVDLGILALSAMDLVFARLDMRVKLLRFFTWALILGTVYLNVAGETDPFSIVAHTILPLLWALAVELAAHFVRTRAGLASETRMDTVRKSRWILSPVSTFALWRRMILWEVRSYPLALQRERDRVLAKTDLQDQYGRLWRIKATRRERALFRLGELAPTVAAVPEAVVTASVVVPELPAVPEVPKAIEPKPRTRKPATATDKPARKRSVPNVDDLMPVGQEIALELIAGGRNLTRDNVIELFRNNGHKISTARASALLPKLKAFIASANDAAPAELVVAA
ncbi:DUF2637 domain-containing protein [Streptosporangium lutulentum]|nr:DUF2637 domain-containing protein [Streptosporangium lutulentum]